MGICVLQWRCAKDLIWKICIFIPSALPPHKDIKEVASVEDRLEMVRLAIADTPEFILSDVELKRPGLSYTIDTVNHFKKNPSTKVELFLVMGIDAFLEIDTWKSFQQLFRMLPMIIMTRPLPDGRAAQPRVGKHDHIYSRKNFGTLIDSRQRSSCYHHDRHHPVYRFNISMLDISGTKIRKQIQQGQSIRFLVPESVEKYIYERGIYA